MNVFSEIVSELIWHHLRKQSAQAIAKNREGHCGKCGRELDAAMAEVTVANRAIVCGRCIREILSGYVLALIFFLGITITVLAAYFAGVMN